MADYTEVFPLGAGEFTVTTSGAVTGGQLVSVSGTGTVAASTTALAATVVGVAGHDAASGTKLTVKPLKMVHETTAGTGGLTAGNPLKSDNTSNVTLWVSGTDLTNTFIGVALNTATATNPVQWIGR